MLILRQEKDDEDKYWVYTEQAANEFSFTTIEEALSNITEDHDVWCPATGSMYYRVEGNYAIGYDKKTDEKTSHTLSRILVEVPDNYTYAQLIKSHPELFV